jgi:hypothetical protein
MASMLAGQFNKALPMRRWILYDKGKGYSVIHELLKELASEPGRQIVEC